VRILASCGALLALVLVSGCGNTQPAAEKPAPAATVAETPTTTASKPTPTLMKRDEPIVEKCHKLETGADYRYCEQGQGPWQLAMMLQARDGGSWRTITTEPPNAFKRHGSRYWGIWRAVWTSPDGRTLLAQWSTECENSYAFFIPAEGGKPRLVTGKLDWNTSPNSIPTGWSADGRARVHVDGGCGDSAWEPGDYLIDPVSGDAEFLG
jgi:hypothetical protein